MAKALLQMGAIAAIGVMLIANVSEVRGQALNGTLKKIKDSGVIVLGVRESSIPFSYLDNNEKTIGYSIDLCMKVVDAVKKQLKMPNLQVKTNAVTSQTRIPLMTNGGCDL
ncbi:MAG: transporter substrate-binding domain-containing protein [Woronichinia naegeliana WA131]|uniref:Transporter substrate-binding domain-containing protein n=1 Tax=Woronichinia naegeliana WA131 TaxID=2824559 RepID=A0A977KXW3_9CYAN|nr:MAG: transporter substrate-binding domain-containing protein [Woronichinia naegeliana WA131]